MKFSALLTYLFFCICYSSTAQVCNGSLGDPALKETFGAGGGYQLASYKTSYQFVGGCPEIMVIIWAASIPLAVSFLVVVRTHGFR